MNLRILGLLAFTLLVFTVPNAGAIFLKPDLEKVPVERLIKNLEDYIEKNPKAYTAKYNLARVHAMAYALKVESTETVKRKTKDSTKDEKKIDKKSGGGPEPWFGYTPPAVPFKAVATEDKAKLEKAMKHLEKAIDTYKELLQDQPTNLAAQLGLAWCIEQSGDKDAAIKAYRETLDNGWAKERKLKTGPLGGNFITKEAAGYLIPLLDPKKDADEIQTLNTQVAILSKLPRPVTPIAVPLRDGLTATDLEDRNATVSFDADGTGPKRWTWITKDAAWLVHVAPRPSPLAPRSKITSGLQLFGNVTFWCFWDNGYEAMRSLDDNGDGQLTGSELKNLALWHDKNGNGRCDPGEVRPLSAYGIVGLSCHWTTDSEHADRIAWSPRGVTFSDGSTRPTFDLILRQR